LGLPDTKSGAAVLDHLQDVCADNLLQRLNALGEVDVISIYAVGVIHNAWIRRPKQMNFKGESNGGSKKR
jgi:hypothetical protein